MFTWIVHLGDVMLMSLLCHSLRIACRRLLRGEILLLCEEFISTGDFCSCCFELAFLYETYGVHVFAVCLFVMCAWWGTCWGDAAVNPNKHLEDYVKGEASLVKALGRVTAEMVAAVSTYWFVQYLWSFDLSPEHQQKSHEKICEADLQVSPMYGAIVEALLTFFDRLNALVSGDIAMLQNVPYTAALSTGLVIAGLNYSGGYFNPALATSLKLGCHGHSTAEFFLVYWIGSIMGCLVALFTYLLVISRITRRKQAID